ncbi:MAG TPA: hypothetical protein VHD88_00340, partial [Pyrinomonadaceae bacterium]|nr:hypothetical protein [Pyrinomonadaceae bacterium]
MNQSLSDQVLAHVTTCASCREFRDERASLRELVGNLGPVTAPADFDMRLRVRMAAERQSQARSVLFAGFRVSTPAIAVAALFVVCAASIVWFVEHHRNQTP